MADWFGQNAPKQTGGDWFSSNAPGAAPADPIKQPEGGPVGRFLGSAWDKLNPLPALKMVADLAASGATGGTRPVSPETAQALSGIITSHGEQFDKAREAHKRGSHVEAAGHLLGALVPLVGPAAAQAGEQMGGTAPKYDRYGNVVEPGKAPDIAGGLGSAAGLAVAASPRNIASAVTKVVPEAVAASAAAKLSESAKVQYSRVLNATKQGNKYRSERIVPQMLERGVKGVTLKGMKETAQASIGRAGQAIDDAWAALPEGTAVPIDSVLQKMQAATNETFTVEAAGGGRMPMGDVAKAGVRQSEALQEVLLGAAEKNPQTGALEIPVARARQLRQYFDEVAKEGGRYDGKALAEASAAKAHGMAADAIRAQLNDFPGIEALNKEYSFWKDVDRVVSDTLTRRQGQAKPLGRKIAAAVGGGAGFTHGGIPGAVVGRMAGEALEQIATSPAWQTVEAVMKDRLAKAIASGNRGAVEFYIAKIAKSAGIATRLTDPELRSGQPALVPAQ